MAQILLISRREETTVFFRRLFSAEDSLVTVGDETLAEMLLQETGFDFILCEGASAEFQRRFAPMAILVSIAGEPSDAPGVFRLEEKEGLSAALPLLRTALDKIRALQTENGKLQKQIDDQRLVARAKRALRKTLGMTEEQAHRYLEKQAMDLREPKGEVARRILATYSD